MKVLFLLRVLLLKCCFVQSQSVKLTLSMVLVTDEWGKRLNWWKMIHQTRVHENAPVSITFNAENVPGKSEEGRQSHSSFLFFSVNKTNKWQIISFKIFWEISSTYYGKSAKSHKPENVGWIPGEAQVFHILLISFVRTNACMPCITHLTNWTLLGDAQDISTCHLHKLFGPCSSGTLWQNIAANFQMS